MSRSEVDFGIDSGQNWGLGVSALPQGSHVFQKRHVFWGLGVKEPSGESFLSKTTRIFATAPFSASLKCLSMTIKE